MRISKVQLQAIINEELENVIREEQLDEAGFVEEASLVTFLTLGLALGAWAIKDLTAPSEHPTLQQYEGEIDQSVIDQVEQRVEQERGALER